MPSKGPIVLSQSHVTREVRPQDLADEVIRRLRDCAKAHRVSLEQEVRDILTGRVTGSPADRVEQIDGALMLTPLLADEAQRIEGWRLIRENRR